MTGKISQKEAIESAWRESFEIDEEIDTSEEKILSSSKWDKIKMKWDKRQERHSYWK